MGGAGEDRTFSIGDVARATRLAVSAIRYYERLGLLSRAHRTTGGRRRYSADVVSELQFVEHAKALGLSLSEIRELTHRGSGDSCRSVRATLDRHLQEVERRLTALRDLRRTLTDLRRECDVALDANRSPDCPALKRMGQDVSTVRRGRRG